MTPLRKYLEKQGITQAEFGQRLESVRGYPASASAVSMWVVGYRLPSKANQLFIESCTAGGVRRKDWERWKGGRNG